MAKKTETAEIVCPLYDERIDKSINRISKSLNMLEVVVDDIKGACQMNNWNDSVAYQIEEAATKLGFALATLTRWYDSLKEE